MNTKLVDSLVQIIESLTPEEQNLLEEKLQVKKNQHNWEEQAQKLQEIRAKIFARRGGKPFDPSLDYYIQEGRDERTKHFDELISDCFKEEKQ